MIHNEKLMKHIEQHRYPLMFATISGAHLYGFPSSDSDCDLRGVQMTIDWQRARSIFNYPKPPASVSERQFDYFDDELQKLATTPYEEIDFGDLWYYLEGKPECAMALQLVDDIEDRRELVESRTAELPSLLRDHCSRGSSGWSL